jgi:predicted enzyme related to lactoylglutathione lyase
MNTSDAQRAAAFYGNVFGWHNAPHPSVEGRSAFTQDTRPLAGLVQATQGTFAHWLTYLSVERLERAHVLTKQLGGSIMVETIELAGIGHASVIQDSVGTIIGLVERS